MCDRITDPIVIQTSLKRKFRPTYDFEIMQFFSLLNFVALLIMWRLFNKYCSNF